jgi:DNA-binding XRE family transcriptional regulator
VGSLQPTILRFAGKGLRAMTMKATKSKRLKKRGWKIGDASEFLCLSAEEQALLELKVTLGHELKMNRMERKWTQAQFAKVVKSSQSRVARMESGDPSVSLDLLVRSLLATGASREDLARVININT